jgi:hypothetical protein
MEDKYKNMKINMEHGIRICSNHAQRALRAFKVSPKLKQFIDDGTIILPETTDYYNFLIKISINGNVLPISFAIAPDRCGNRYELDEISEINPPSTMETLLGNGFDEVYEALGYYDDIRSFDWNQNFYDDGFEKIIDEFIRIRNIINGLN